MWGSTWKIISQLANFSRWILQRIVGRRDRNNQRRPEAEQPPPRVQAQADQPPQIQAEAEQPQRAEEEGQHEQPPDEPVAPARVEDNPPREQQASQMREAYDRQERAITDLTQDVREVADRLENQNRELFDNMVAERQQNRQDMEVVIEIIRQGLPQRKAKTCRRASKS